MLTALLALAGFAMHALGGVAALPGLVEAPVESSPPVGVG